MHLGWATSAFVFRAIVFSSAGGTQPAPPPQLHTIAINAIKYQNLSTRSAPSSKLRAASSGFRFSLRFSCIFVHSIPFDCIWRQTKYKSWRTWAAIGTQVPWHSRSHNTRWQQWQQWTQCSKGLAWINLVLWIIFFGEGFVAKDLWVHQGFVSFLDWDYTIKSFKQWLLNG